MLSRVGEQSRKSVFPQSSQNLRILITGSSKAFLDLVSAQQRAQIGGATEARVVAATEITDETVKVCAYNFSESAFLWPKQAIIDLALRTI